MKLAVLILCHKSPKQVNSLINALDNESIDCFVHVDKKSDFAEQIVKRKNVYVIPDELRVDVKWGRFSMVTASTNLLNYARAHSEYDYFWQISGQDFLICSPKKILAFLEENKGSNFINVCKSRYNGLPQGNAFDKRADIYYPTYLIKRTPICKLILKAYSLVTGGPSHTFSIFRRKAAKKIKPCFGACWWCLHSDFVSYALECIENDARLVKFFNNVAYPDESIFQTLIVNSQFSDSQKQYLHYIDWSQGNTSPKDLTVSDFDAIISSGMLMTRKINEDFALIAMLEDHIKQDE